MMKNTASQFFTKEEIASLTERSDMKGFQAIATTWVIIFFCFWLVHTWSNPLTVILALLLIGGRQLGLAILMHEASHLSLFKTRWMNNFFGQWFAAFPVLQNVRRYKDYHLAHHKYNGTEKDPDLGLANKYPMPKRQFIQAVTRDLTGRVGLKAVIGSLLIGAGVVDYQINGKPGVVPKKERTPGKILRNIAINLPGPILFQIGLYWLVSTMFSGWVYLLWPVSFMTTYMLILRIRSLAEHALMPDPFNALQNARTTHATIVDRLLFAPHNVNYHLEHHMLMSVPYYQLPRMHEMLRQKNAFDEDSCVEPGYWQIIKKAVV